ncbi:Uncharacterized protein DBV15_06696 [Temnothorax longispinosus]|uniref:Uncharacterized protein n=1 Tax=Temnothorax longispinosus TaxID=300112 RepID=A0A4S2L0D0_9HYME|nr:Uncharacterized protein DBV15_06696 [Temnothorax longispinosus]
MFESPSLSFSLYFHARSAFDPSAYARNQKATSLTRVSVTHQPLKIPPGWLAGCLPAGRSFGRIDVSRKKERRTDSERRARSLSSGKRLSFSENGKLENLGLAYTCIPSSTACEWQTLNEKERNPFYPSGTNRGLFPPHHEPARRGARMHSRTRERGNGSRYPAAGSVL